MPPAFVLSQDQTLMFIPTTMSTCPATEQSDTAITQRTPTSKTRQPSAPTAQNPQPSQAKSPRQPKPTTAARRQRCPKHRRPRIPSQYQQCQSTRLVLDETAFAACYGGVSLVASGSSRPARSHRANGQHSHPPLPCPG